MKTLVKGSKPNVHRLADTFKRTFKGNKQLIALYIHNLVNQVMTEEEREQELLYS